MKFKCIYIYICVCVHNIVLIGYKFNHFITYKYLLEHHTSHELYLKVCLATPKKRGRDAMLIVSWALTLKNQ